MRTTLPATGAVWLVMLASIAGPARAQPPATVDPLLLQPPKTPEDVSARADLARARLEALQPTTQPTTEPADETTALVFETRAALYQEWQAYLGQVERVATLQADLAALSSEQRIADLSSELKELERLTAELAAQPRPLSATEAEVAEITALHKDLDGQLTALSELQTRRAAQLATGFKQQRAGLQQELEEARQARQAFRAQTDSATTTAPAEQEQRDLQRRRYDVQIARLELTLRALDLEVDQTELASNQDQRRLEALRRYAGVAHERMTALAANRGRTTLETIAASIEQAGSAPERAFLELQYFAERVLVHYFRNRKLLGRLQRRFASSDLDRLRERVTASAGLWENTTESAAYRSGADVLQLRAEVRGQRRQFEAELTDLRARLGTSVAELHELQSARDRTLRRFGELKQVLLQALESAEPAERTRLETRTTSLRSSLEASIGTTVTEARQLATRLGEAVTLLEGHLASLQLAADQLYWTALQRRDSGLAGISLTAARSELRQLLGAPPTLEPASAPGEPSLAEAGIVTDTANVRARLAASMRAARRDLGTVTAGGWTLIAVLAVLAGAGGWALRSYAKRRVAHALQQLAVAGPAAAGADAQRRFSARMDVLTWRLAGDVALPLAVLAALWVGAWFADLPARTRAAAGAVSGTLLAVYALLRLVRHLFQRDSEQRVVPCANGVARHYRYWCKLLLVFSLIILPLLILLAALQTVDAVRTVLWEVWKTGVLLILLGFLSRRDRAVGRLDAQRRAWLTILLTALVPLLFVAVLGLLVLQIIGYGVLVEFLGAGVLASAAVMTAIFAAVEYLCDLLDKYAGPAPDAARPGSYVLRLLKSLLRVAGLAAAAILIVYIWGGGAYLQWLDWRMAAWLTLVVIAALILDRVALTALGALQRTGRLPELTARIIRRWLRGFLIVVVFLLVITLAGARTDRLWAPLSALLAMVAIGFVAVWSLLSNVLATLMILIWRPFSVGEHIEVRPEGVAGKVVDINFLYTLLKSDTGALITVPNALFVQKFVQREKVPAKPSRTLAEQLEAEKPADE